VFSGLALLLGLLLLRHDSLSLVALMNFGRVAGLIALDLSLGPRPLTERNNDTKPVPTAIKKRK
jgi:hypothetical protein